MHPAEKNRDILSKNAQNAVSFVHDHLLQLLMEVGNTVGVVPEEVEEMKDELRKIQVFLQDANRLVVAEGVYRDGEIKKRGKQLIEAAFRLEDVIDEYVICEEQQQPRRDPGCAASLSSCEVSHFIKTMILRHQIRSRYRDFKSRVREIKQITADVVEFDAPRDGLDRVGSLVVALLSNFIFRRNQYAATARLQSANASSDNEGMLPMDSDDSASSQNLGEDAPYTEAAENVGFEDEPSYRLVRGRIVGGVANASFRENDEPPYIEEAQIVGFDEPSHKLVSWLVEGRAERTIVSVVGMGGVGKTTLAKKVFNTKEIVKHFDCHAWITVSRSYTIGRLLGDLLCKFYEQKGEYPPQDIFEMDGSSLTNEVTNYLHQKRYVVFFDDIWNTDFWDKIKFALIDNMKGSRIFITTRSMNVAVSCKRSSCVEVYKLQPLNLKRSLELFYTRAFGSEFEGNCPKDLKDISYEIVDKCNGLPLAIVAIGDLLAGKAKNEWKRFSQNLSSELQKNSHLYGIADSLSLSYDDLPSILQPCLLYFAIYPQAYEVKSKKLIRQWIAERFVKHESGRTLEEVAEVYLAELINRSLVQVSSISIDGRVKGCRVHTILHDMIRRKVEDLSFCSFISKDGESTLSGIIRRLSIATISDDLVANIESLHVWSLLFFTEEELPEHLLGTILTKYKLLKLLDFESAGSFDVPENLGDFIHLKYLNFRNTEVQSLPKSIGNLQNLETLDLRQTAVSEMPKEVSKLRKLRHLLGNKLCLIHLKGGIGEMTSLHTLSEVQVDEDGIELIRELGKLTQLRKLSLFGVREELGTALCSSISEMQHLEKLHIETKSEDAAIDLSLVSCPPYMLRKLRLHGKLNKLPWWIPQLHNLVELSLSHSRLTDDPLKSLKDLPNLLLLNLAAHSYEGECLHFQEGGFQVLKELGLRYLHGLSSIIIDEGALCSLKELTFMKIPKLKKAPSGMLQLQKLEVLKTHFMPTEFEQSIVPLTQLVKDKKLGK